MQEQMERYSFLCLLLLVTALFLYLLKPFFGVIFWACAIAVLFYPVQWRLTERFNNRPSLAAAVTLLLCFVIVIVPTLLVVTSFFREGIALYERLETSEINPGEWLDDLQHTFPVITDLIQRLDMNPDNVREQLTGAAVAGSRFVAQHAVSVGQGTLTLFIGIGAMLYVAFFMLRDGPKLVALLIRALPLGDEREKMLFSKFAEVTRATVKGNLIVAMVQGSLGGLMFWILGIPGPFLWAAVMTVLSLLPVVGASLIWGPVAIYLFATGEWVDGLILTAFGAIVIGLVDNILRPILVGRDTKLPDYIVLLSTLGGFVLFGINGFVIGPLIAALFVAFWQIFMRDFYHSSRDGEEEIEAEVKKDAEG
jgi:predicted PurR-regulated permease PerM